ncbi:MAG: tripartite tricarboxylate transporter substrate binding protein [Chloroflexota bacterium]
MKIGKNSIKVTSMPSFSCLVKPTTRTLGAARAGALAAAFVAAVSLPMPFHAAHAQSYPSKPIRLVLPMTVGGITDILARVIADPMEKDLGQPIIIISRPGAGTVIGVDYVAKAAPDGYTLLLSGDAGVINTASGRPLPYDLMKDLVPISGVYSGAQLLMVNKDSRFKSLQDLVMYAKANPGRLKFGSTGIGNSTHLSAESFNQAAGIQAVHVPYKGGAAPFTDLMGGHIDYMILGSTAAIPAIKDGSLRGLAIMSKDRTPLLPDLPTAVEQGVNVQTSGWYGLYTTAGTPPETVKKLHASLTKALHSKAVQDRFVSVGGQAMSMTPEQFLAFLQAEIQKQSVLIKRLGIKLE